jgi:hypothetical protein
MTSQAVLKKFCNINGSIIEQEKDNEWGDEQICSRDSGLPRRLYLNPCQTVISGEVQYTNPCNLSRLKLFFF